MATDARSGLTARFRALPMSRPAVRPQDARGSAEGRVRHHRHDGRRVRRRMAGPHRRPAPAGCWCCCPGTRCRGRSRRSDWLWATRSRPRRPRSRSWHRWSSPPGRSSRSAPCPNGCSPDASATLTILARSSSSRSRPATRIGRPAVALASRAGHQSLLLTDQPATNRLSPPGAHTQRRLVMSAPQLPLRSSAGDQDWWICARPRQDRQGLVWVRFGARGNQRRAAGRSPSSDSRPLSHRLGGLPGARRAGRP